MKALFYYCINSSEVKKVEIHVPDNLKDNEDYTKDFKTKKKQEIIERNYTEEISDNIFNYFNLNEIIKNTNKINNINVKNTEENNIKNSEILFDINKINKTNNLTIGITSNIKDLLNRENDKLIITDFDDGKLLMGKKYIINASGLENLNGLRKIKDSHVYFGTNQLINNNNIDILIDYPKEILFDIFFDLKINQFFFKVLNNENNSNRFYQKVEKLFIDKLNIFNLNVIIFSIEPIENKELKLIIYLENEKKEFRLKPKKLFYTLGRKKNCDFIIHLSVISKVQCSFIFDNERNKWLIIDGDYNQKKKSTNGLWVYLNNNELEINDKETFLKIGNNIIQIDLVGKNE